MIYLYIYHKTKPFMYVNALEVQDQTQNGF